MGTKYELKGMTFGFLKVEAPLGVRNGKRYWRCRCVCGKRVDTFTAALTSGNTGSCGCRRGVKKGERATPKRFRTSFVCDRCGKEFANPEPDRLHYIKYCTDCKVVAEELKRQRHQDAQREKKMKQRYEQRELERLDELARMGREHGERLEAITAMARAHGVSYGHMQAMRHGLEPKPQQADSVGTVVDWQACRAW